MLTYSFNVVAFTPNQEAQHAGKIAHCTTSQRSHPFSSLTTTRQIESIQDDVDAEWKYARSLLYMEYISEKCVAPVPLNILQCIRDVIATVVTIIRYFKEDGFVPRPSSLMRNRRRHACYSDTYFSDVSEVGVVCRGFTR